MSQTQLAKLQPLKRKTLKLKFDPPLAYSLIAIHGNLFLLSLLLLLLLLLLIYLFINLLIYLFIFIYYFLSAGNSVTSIASEYVQRKRDRRWKLACGYNKAVKYCAWTSYKNDWDKPLRIECPHYGFIAGKYN